MKQGNRGKGRSSETWRMNVGKHMKGELLSWSEPVRRFQNRHDWKLHVRGLYPDKGDGRFMMYSQAEF